MSENFNPNGNFLFTEEEFNKAYSRKSLPVRCLNCGKTFYLDKNIIQRVIKGTRQSKFCSKKCQGEYISQTHNQIVQCKQCGKECKKQNSAVKNSSNHFCSKSCSVKYHNTHKTFGYRRSKLELHLQNVLESKYLNLNIEYNDRLTLDGLELDIYIPSLNLAFELNGIFHYQPVFGKNTESKEQIFNDRINKDIKKQELCQEKKINLCVIDISTQKHFTIKSSQKFVDAICFVIDERLKQLNQQGLVINDVKVIKDPNIIPPSKKDICKYCGQPKDQGEHKYCKKFQILTSFKKFGFDESTIGTTNFEKEFERIIELIRSEYWDNKLSLIQIAKKYQLTFKTISNLLDYFNIPKRNFSESLKNYNLQKSE